MGGGGAICKQSINKLLNPLHLLRRFGLVSIVPNRDVTQSRTVERSVCVQSLILIFRPSGESAIIEKLRCESAYVRMQPPSLLEEQSLLGFNGRSPVKQVS